MTIVEWLRTRSSASVRLGEAADEIEALQEALLVAAKALAIADKYCPEVQVDPPRAWGLESDSEDTADGWCSTSALARKLHELEGRHG